METGKARRLVATTLVAFALAATIRGGGATIPAAGRPEERLAPA